MTVAEKTRTWHVQLSIDPRVIALMCPWMDCGALSADLDPGLLRERIGRSVNCAHCGLPSIVPDYTKET